MLLKVKTIAVICTVALASILAAGFAMGLISLPAMANKTGTWQKRCSEQNYCEAYNRIQADEKGTSRLAEFAIGFPQNTPTARGVVILPLGILVQPGVGFHIDEKHSYKFAINHCSDQGCFAYIDLNDKIVDQMKKGNEASFVFFAANSQKLRIPMTLSGFTSIYNSIR